MNKWRKYSAIVYILIPLLSVLICRLLKLAQGEKNEEIVFGIFLGIVLDVIIAVVNTVLKVKAGKKNTK